MNTKAFGNNYVGIKLNSVSEIMKYNALRDSFSICDEVEYYFDEYVEVTHDNGEVTEREPTENEKLERILEAFKNGSALYATFWLDCGEVVPSAATTYQSEFYVGQEIYTMSDNKIVKAKIEYLSLASDNISGSARFKDAYLKEVATRLYFNIGCKIKPFGIESPSFQSLDEISQLIRKYCLSDFVIIGLTSYGTMRTLNEIFATKEQLVKHLMEE